MSSDLGTNFTSQLTKEFEKRFGCSPRFNCPFHLSSTGLAERGVGNVKPIISKLATDHPKQWHKYVPTAMWCLRETINETNGVAPWIFGFLPRGPLAILKDSWCGENLPVNLVRMQPHIYVSFIEKLEITKSYAASHAEREQNRYAAHYNLRSRDKHFGVGERVLVLMPDSISSRMFSKWSGPGSIVEVRSPYSYIVDVDGVQKYFHANKLRKFHVRVDSVTCDSFNDDLETRSVNTCATILHMKVIPILVN